MLKIMHLCFDPGLSFVLSFLQAEPQNRHWLFRQSSTRAECPSFLPVISLGCFLSFDIFHCLNCNTFVSRYSPQCNAVKSLLESFILHCSRLIAHRALQLSRVLTPGHWTGLVFFIISLHEVILCKVNIYAYGQDKSSNAV